MIHRSDIDTSHLLFWMQWRKLKIVKVWSIYCYSMWDMLKSGLYIVIQCEIFDAIIRVCCLIYINSFISFNKCLMKENLHKNWVFEVRSYRPANMLSYGGFSSSNICEQIQTIVASNISHWIKTIDLTLTFKNMVDCLQRLLWSTKVCLLKVYGCVTFEMQTGK